MNTLLFLCGAGVGALLAFIVMMVIVGFVVRSNKRSQEHIARTEKLLEDRNSFNERIAAATESLVDWTQHNWDFQK